MRSIVGRFLEHSRIFRFGTADRGFDHYISSADLMPRNLDRRVEVAMPVKDPSLQARLDQILEMELADDVLAWELDHDSVWHRVGERAGRDVQQRLMAIAKERSAGGPP